MGDVGRKEWEMSFREMVVREGGGAGQLGSSSRPVLSLRQETAGGFSILFKRSHWLLC